MRKQENKDDGTEEPANKLMQWLQEESGRQDINFTDLSKKLDISRPYLYALRHGQRQTESIDRSLIERIAKFLKKPVASIYMAAGVLRSEDFYNSTKEQLEVECLRAFDYISNDPQWGPFCPRREKFELGEQLFIIDAYQRATGRVLLPDREIIDYLQGEKEGDEKQG